MSNEEKKDIDQLIQEIKSKKTGLSKTSPQKNGEDLEIKKKTPKIASEEITEKFEKKMKEIELKEKERLAEQKAKQLGYEYINLQGFPISEQALISIPRKIAKEEKTICFFNDGQEVRVAAVNPNNKTQEILDNIIKETTHNGSGKIYLISEQSFEQAYKNYARIPEIKEIKYGIEISGKDLEELRPKVRNFGILNAMINEEKNITKLVTMIIAGAIESNASDIHIEAEEKDVVLRYRIDGVMQTVGKMEKKKWKPLDSRIKTIAGLKINVTDVPQDGRITIYLGENDKLELRVSTLPTAFGESIVMRLLKSSAASLKFEDLGMRGKQYEDMIKATEKTTGMIVTTGPTGSGKTTTLYAILNKLNDGKTKIITLEDPIEYKLPGIAQSQIDHSKNYSFADGLRSLMRQDPDIIMVGELRDTETVEVAIEAALTGHKVISTIHTNDAAGAIPRFLSMGAQPYLLAPALNAVMGQRLVRRIHDKCRIEFTPDPQLLTKAQEIIDNLPENSGYQKPDLTKIKWTRGQGCEECKHIGYKGRIGIYEIFAMNKDFEKLILSGNVSAYDMATTAHKHGMITMVQDGILKAVDGITSLEEVFRVAG